MGRSIPLVVAAILVSVQAAIEGPNFADRAARPEGVAFKDWNLECDRRRSIGGMKSRVYVSPDFGTDVQVLSFCRSIAHTDDPLLRISERDCRTTEPVTIGKDDLKFDDIVHNCAKSEFVRAIRSDYNEGNRTMLLECCKPFNAELDKYVGCNIEGPIDLYSTYHGFLKDPYDPRSDCPRDALVGVALEGNELKFKFCPFRIAGRSYLTLCPELKATAVGQAKLSDISVSVENLFRLKEDTWSGVHQNWRFECKGMKVLKAISTGFAFHADEVRRDVLMKFRCGQIVEEQTQMAKKVRVATWTLVSWSDFTIDDYGCQDNEAMIGVASFFDQAKQQRFLSLICADHSNSLLVEDSVSDDTQVLRWGEVIDVSADEGMSVYNMAFQLQGSAQVSKQVLIGTWEFQEESAYNISTRTDENTGEEINPWTPELDVDLRVDELPRIAPGEESPIGESWRASCTEFEAVQTMKVSFKKEDFVYTINCAKMFEDKQTARIVRITKWATSTSAELEAGCRDDEVLYGLNSYFNEDDGSRYISYMCMDNSNAKASTPEPAYIDLTDANAAEVALEGAFVRTFFMESESSVNAHMVKYMYLSKAKFTESTLINEIEAVSSQIIEQNPEELEKVEEDTFTTAGEGYKFECTGGLKAISVVNARNRILADGTDDQEMKFVCSDVINGTNTATKTRWTGWMDVHSMKIKLGCRDHEFMTGIAGHWEPSKPTRYYSALCTEASNADVSEGPRVVVFEVTESGSEASNGTAMSGSLLEEDMEFMQNLLASGFNYQQVRTEFTTYLVKMKYLEEPKFTESSRTNDATGEVEETLDASALANTPLDSLEPGDKTAPGQNFQFICEDNSTEAITKMTMQVAEWKDGLYDVVYSFECAPVVEDQNWAYKIRTGKYAYISKFREGDGCKETEILVGMNSIITDKGTRFVQPVCLEMSNAEIDDEKTPEDYTLSLDELTAQTEGYFVRNFYTTINDDEVFKHTIVWTKYTYKKIQAFGDCALIDDTSGDNTPIEGCGDDSGGLGPGEKGEGFCALNNTCPYPWTYDSSCPKLYGCYKMVDAPYMSFNDAKSECESKYGGQMAIIDTHAKWQFVRDNLPQSGKRMWFGLYRPDGVTSVSTWSDNKPFKFDTWMPINPAIAPIVESCGIVRNDS